MPTNQKTLLEERLAQLERERELIVAALIECQTALGKGLDAAFAVGRFVGAVEVLFGSLPTAARCQQANAETPVVAQRKPISKQVLVTKKELCDHLKLHNIKSVERMMREKRIPFVRVSPRQVRFDVRKVEEALNRYEYKAAKYPSED